MKGYLVMMCLILLGMFTGVAFAGESVIGSVQKVQGTAEISREGTSHAATQGMQLFEKDILSTGEDGSMGIIMRDNSRFSMGAKSELDMQKFVFIPKKSEFSLVTRMVKGTFVYMSGLIAKISPESIRMETPVGSLAVRGTKMLVRLEEK